MNYLENSVKNNFVMCDDKTGKTLDISQRTDAVDTLKLLHEVHGIFQRSQPKVETFEVFFALRSLCEHMGWSPNDIAVVEQYAMAGQALAGGPVPASSR